MGQPFSICLSKQGSREIKTSHSKNNVEPTALCLRTTKSIVNPQVGVTLAGSGQASASQMHKSCESEPVPQPISCDLQLTMQQSQTTVVNKFDLLESQTSSKATPEHRRKRQASNLTAHSTDDTIVFCHSELKRIRTNDPTVLFSYYSSRFPPPIFDSTAHEPIMPPEGVACFLNDVELHPEEFPVLVFAWLCGASQMCQFKLSEWCRGITALQTSGSLRELSSAIRAKADNVATDPLLFSELYTWSFTFALEPRRRSLEISTAIALWHILWPPFRRPPVVNRWISYLQLLKNISSNGDSLSNGHRRSLIPSKQEISRDTWTVFLKFVEVVGTEFSRYSMSDAWPTLIDQYVDYELNLPVVSETGTTSIT